MNIKIKSTANAIQDALIISSVVDNFKSLVQELNEIKGNFENNWTVDQTSANNDRDSIIENLTKITENYNTKIIIALDQLANAICDYSYATEKISNLVLASNGASITPAMYYNYMEEKKLAMSPNFSNEEAWLTKNTYAKNYYTANGVKNYIGQCTWFAWGRFYEIYGYDPGFSGNGKECVTQLLSAHPDKFTASTDPVAGAIFSVYPKNADDPGHVGIILSVDGDTITYQDGNYDGYTNSFEKAKTDWNTVTIKIDDFKAKFGDNFANPNNPPDIGNIECPFVEKDDYIEVPTLNTVSA